MVYTHRIYRRRAQAVVARAHAPPWWVWAGLAAGLLAGTAPGWSQTVVPEVVRPEVVRPEVVRPGADTPTLPPNAGNDTQLTQPRSENPLTRPDGTRPLPDNGVIVPPPSAPGSTPVIRPPVIDNGAVIAPPGSPGGDPMVVPK